MPCSTTPTLFPCVSYPTCHPITASMNKNKNKNKNKDKDMSAATQPVPTGATQWRTRHTTSQTARGSTALVPLLTPAVRWSPVKWVVTTVSVATVSIMLVVITFPSDTATSGAVQAPTLRTAHTGNTRASMGPTVGSTMDHSATRAGMPGVVAITEEEAAARRVTGVPVGP